MLSDLMQQSDVNETDPSGNTGTTVTQARIDRHFAEIVKHKVRTRF